MPARGPDLRTLLVEHHQRRGLAGSTDPSGLQWFVEVTFADANWYRDRTRVNSLVDSIAAAPWFREFDVFAPDHRPGTPFSGVDDVRDLIATDESNVAIFAHGEPRMTVSIAEAETALALSFTPRRLEIRLWFAAASVARYKGLVVTSVTSLLFALKEDAWKSAFVSQALATPDPVDGVRYRRTRPQRLATRALNAVVDVFDRDCRGDVGPNTANTAAMIDVPVPADVERIERGSLVANVWISDPSDIDRLAEACSRHEQWAVSLALRIRGGWPLRERLTASHHKLRDDANALVRAREAAGA